MFFLRLRTSTSRRILRVIVMLWAASLSCAHGQIGIYAEGGGEKNGLANTGTVYGATLGAYFDSTHFVFLSTGADVRGSFYNDSNNSLNSFLAGPRLAIRPRPLPVKPYVEAVGGLGHAQFGQGSAKTSATKFAYQFLGGADLTFLPRLDWRVIEFSYGGLAGLNGSYHPKSISTGLVFRLP